MEFLNKNLDKNNYNEIFLKLWKKILVIIWPSASWKTTLQNNLILKYPHLFCTIDSLVTREPRKNDKNYKFCTNEEFENYINQWKIFEYTNRWNKENPKYYWYLNEDIDFILNSWKIPIFILEEHWLNQVMSKKMDFEITWIFMDIPDIKTMIQRIIDRTKDELNVNIFSLIYDIKKRITEALELRDFYYFWKSIKTNNNNEIKIKDFKKVFSNFLTDYSNFVEWEEKAVDFSINLLMNHLNNEEKNILLKWF